MSESTSPGKEAEEQRISVARDGQAAETFLLKELELMEGEIKRLRGEGQARLQFLFTITSAMLGALVALSGVGGIADAQLRGASIAATFMLFVFSLATFEYTVGRDISTDRNVRATSRIRRYFLYHSPELRTYLSWQTEDGPTQWVSCDRSRVRSLVLLIAAGLGALCTGLIAFEVFGEVSIGYDVGISIGLLTAAVLKVWALHKLRRAKDAALVEQRFSDDRQR